MSKKFTMAVVTVALSAIAAQAHATQSEIRIDSSKVDTDLKSQILGLMSERTPGAILGQSAPELFKALSMDGEMIDIDVEMLVAMRIDDSTKSGLPTGDIDSAFKSNALNCYTNCHRACHGSRSWR